MNALFLTTALALAPASDAPQPPVEVPQPPAISALTHEVLPGESLSWIATCEMGDGDRWTELFELNADRITDPDVIQAGWQLVLPEGAGGECPTDPPVQANSTEDATPVEEPSSDAAPSTSASTTDREPAATTSQQGAGGPLDGIRECESGGDYGAVSGSGQYRGAYQFDQQTWESVGGSGDPAAASPAEQDRRAAALYEQQGSSPWPNCG